MNVEMGFDIATAVSILIAAGSYLWSQAKLRQQNKNIFILENIKEILNLASDAKIKLNILYNNVSYLVGEGKTMEKTTVIDMHKSYSELMVKIETKHTILNTMLSEKEKDSLNATLTNLQAGMKKKPEQFLREAPSILDAYIENTAEILKERFLYV